MIIFRRRAKTFPFVLTPGNAAGEEAALIIKEVANHYKKMPMIRNLSVGLVRELQSHDQLGEIKKIFYWVRNNIRYISDIKGCETLQLPEVTLPYYASLQYGIGAGDCDDHVTLLASMLLSIGVSNLRMRLVKYKPNETWKHIYLVVNHKGQDYVMDAINKKQMFGWEVPHLEKKDINLWP